MLLEAAVACLIIGRIAGGRFHRFSRLPFRALWLFAIGFALQVVASLPFMLPAAPAVRIVSYLFLFAGVLANWSLWELRIAGLGVLLNFLVITANGGKMPASPAALARIGRPAVAAAVRSGRHPRNSLMTERTRLAFLCDRLLIPAPYPRPDVFSLGDVVLTIGVCALIFRGMGSFDPSRPSS
jgi:hypothetical protein